MWDKVKFEPGKISMIDFQLAKGNVEAPADYESEDIKGYQFDYNFQMAFNLADKLAKTEFIVSITTESKDASKVKATAAFHFIFIYKIKDINELVKSEKEQNLNIHPHLANALAAISYSTARGILLTRLQGTVLKNFILPVIDPNKLLAPDK